MNRTTLIASLSLIGLALAPANATAQEAGEQGMRPAEVKAARLASRLVLGAQQQERAIAATLDPEGFEQEIVRLRESIRQLRKAERAASLRSGSAADGPSAPGTGDPGIAGRREDLQQDVLSGVGQLAGRRAALEARLSAIPSTRQRRTARAMATKLQELERELQEAMEASPPEREPRLLALEKRLELHRRPEKGGERATPPEPSVQVIPRTSVRPLTLGDAGR